MQTSHDDFQCWNKLLRNKKFIYPLLLDDTFSEKYFSKWFDEFSHFILQCEFLTYTYISPVSLIGRRKHFFLHHSSDSVYKKRFIILSLHNGLVLNWIFHHQIVLKHMLQYRKNRYSTLKITYCIKKQIWTQFCNFIKWNRARCEWNFIEETSISENLIIFLN